LAAREDGFLLPCPPIFRCSHTRFHGRTSKFFEQISGYFHCFRHINLRVICLANAANRPLPKAVFVNCAAALVMNFRACLGGRS
jgi:hypothetical protein